MFVVVGEAVVDLVGQRGSRTFVAHPGGSPANVALGLARLGGAVTLVTRLGRDVLGEMVLSHLGASGVRVDPEPDKAFKTSLAIAELASGAASYDFRVDWDIGRLAALPTEACCVHSGSLATVLQPGGRNVVDLLEAEHQRRQVTISYDPNVRAGLMGEVPRVRSHVEHLVTLSDVVKVSNEDLHWLYPELTDEAIARWWLATGPALVVVTRGAAGAYAATSNVELSRTAPSIGLVDTVGAGDAFSSGLLDALHRADLLGGSRRSALAAIDEETLMGVVDFAVLVAAFTCSRPGADPPTRAEVDGPRGRSTSG